MFRDEARDVRMRQLFFAGEIKTFQIVVPAFGAIAGPFQISALEYRGEHAGDFAQVTRALGATLGAGGPPDPPRPREAAPRG